MREVKGDKGPGHYGKKNFFGTFFSYVPWAIKLEGGGVRPLMAWPLRTFFAASLIMAVGFFFSVKID